MQFVNLLSYHSEARYPKGHDLARAGLSGAEAYGRYGAVALEHVARRGGTLVLYNDVLQVLIGQTAPWDQIAVMQYPETDAFVDMIRDPIPGSAGPPQRRPGRDGDPGVPPAALSAPPGFPGSGCQLERRFGAAEWREAPGHNLPS